MKRTTGFTLLELLVVVTIIVVLLALLAPAMDKAIYAAEFAACAAQQDGIATGAVSYAMNNKRAYPHRAGTNESTSGNYFPMYITLPFNVVHNKGNPSGYDDRPLLRPYMNINAMLDPLAPDQVDLDGSAADSFIATSYSLWFGWKYTEPPAGHPTAFGFERYGQRWSWDGRDYSVLLGDTHGHWGFSAHFFAHQDREAVGWARVRREEAWGGGPAMGQDKNTLALWEIAGVGLPEGPQFDSNYAFQDGSVRGYKDIYADIPWFSFIGREKRFNTVPMYHRVGGTYPGSWLAIPKEN